MRRSRSDTVCPGKELRMTTEPTPPAQTDESPAAPAAAVDAARARLEEVDAAPLEDHVELYNGVHRTLQEGLADLDDA
jgi:hypothetical protein